MNLENEHKQQEPATSQTLVHEEDILSLVGRAMARERFPDLGFVDAEAERLLASLDLEGRTYDDREMRASVVRTMAMDGIVADFLARHPEALVVGVHGGLSTRFSRVDNGTARFIDLDAPPVASFKRHVFGERDRHVLATSCSLACIRWMDCASASADVPMMLVTEGTMRRAGSVAAEAFLTAASLRMPKGTELAADYDARAPLRASKGLRGGCLEVPLAYGELARFPRLRIVPSTAYSEALAYEVDGISAVSRLFGGNSPAIVHVRFD